MKRFNLDISNVPNELRFIIELLKNEDIATINPIVYKNIDWKAFIELLFHHRLYPIIYSKLKQFDGGIVPPDVVNYISIYYKKNTLQMLKFSAVTENISRLFAENRIPLILLKGPALGHLLYGDISLRTSSDLDFLVPIEELEKTDRLLAEQGYQKHDYIKTVLNDWKWRHHHVTYYHPQQQIKMEIHWRLNPGPAKEPGFQELWERKNRSKFTSFPVYLLGKEDLFLFLTSHGARHGWSRLRWLVDIQELVKQEIDWKKVNDKLRVCYYKKPAGQGLLLASCLLNSGISHEMQRLMKAKSTMHLAQQAVYYLENRINLHTDPVPEDVAHFHKHHLFSLMGWRQKWLFLLSFLYPYPDDVETLPLPKTLHFLYFPLRPILWAYRKTRKIAFS
ncbi:nucleotidyltransferase domain-containing protein [Virgibacillus doumboii]|uniref:nucleotidyltransferase domain-containing protein n=1 Tax=Virgibacillus doumboii TaxID=2697503 RepID=UPI0013E0D49F|nr:nucleotidyltransferase family protein [Virgibacillus doumboii]